MNIHLPHRIQRGAVLLLLMMVFLISGIWLGIRYLGSVPGPANPDVSGLIEARNILLAAVITAAGPVIAPGRLPTPDFLDPVEAPANNYDGDWNSCATSTWVPGAGLPAIGGTLAANTRCFGRIPWRTLALGQYASVPQSDPRGVIPWYAMSPNVISGCIPKLNPSILNTTYTPFPPGTCKTVAQPFPWLTVRDPKGNLITDRAAAVLILPGPALGSQNRTSTALPGPRGYLDSVTVAATCIQPCVPGTYDNARFNWPNNVGLSFIQCAPADTVDAKDVNYAAPYACNDRLTFITIEELMEVTERAAMQHAAGRLRQYFSINGFFPYAAPLGTVSYGECQDLTLSGLLPSKATTSPGNPNPCTHARFDSAISYPQPFYFEGWFNVNDWGDYIYYAVAPGCTQFSPTESSRQDCKGSSARLASGAINNARAILIGTGAPIVAHPYADLMVTGQVRPSSNIADYLDSPENRNGDNRFDATDKKVARNFVDSKVGRSYGYNDKVLVVAP